ncbi:hypothetical protein AOQ84DRAFT_229758 [Glonium stellatum]|uniref:Uncharacterized protein n=1 Tax=Glonium stellatum TaxID=574774 RepID=A0A8E2JVP0_9PEZI|nr:hypothetical protein AOQ84DRAFT_229758 [Glonium stellatum]
MPALIGQTMTVLLPPFSRRPNMYHFYPFLMWFSELSRLIVHERPYSEIERYFIGSCTDDRNPELLREKLPQVSLLDAVFRLKRQLNYIRSREDLLADGGTLESLLAMSVASNIIRNELNRLGMNTVDAILILMHQTDSMHRQGVLIDNDRTLLLEWLDEAAGHIPEPMRRGEVFFFYDGYLDEIEIIPTDVAFEPTGRWIDALTLGYLCFDLPEGAKCPICLCEFSDKSMDSDTRVLQLSKCDHAFHYACLDELGTSLVILGTDPRAEMRIVGFVGMLYFDMNGVVGYLLGSS